MPPKKITLNHVYDLLNDFTVLSDRKFQNIEDRVKNIQENHLVHLQSDSDCNKLEHKWLKETIEGISKKQWWAFTMSLIVLIGIVIDTYLTFNK